MRKKRTIGGAVALCLLATVAPAALQLAGASADQVKTSKNFRMKPSGFLRGKDGIGLAVKPGNRNHIVQVNTDWVTATCEHGASFDGGKTWTRGVLEGPAGLPVTCDSLGHGSSSMDQSVVFGTGNNVYTTFGASAGTGDGQSIAVAKSTNGGRSFAPAVVAMPGGANRVQGPAYRLPKILADGDTLYVVAWEAAGSASDPTNPPYDRIVVARSDDGGATWSNPVVASDPAVRSIEPSQLVLVDGSLHVAYRTRGFNGSIVLASSDDGGLTWTPTTAVAVKGYDAGTTQFSASTFSQLAGDPDNGNLYIVYQQVPNADGSYPGQADHFIGPDADILFIRSSDGGATWSRPEVINELVPGELTQNRHPQISLAPNGRIDVTWHDRRHSFGIDTCPNTHSPPAGTAPCTEARLGDTYYAYSTDNGQTWSDNRRITDRSINNEVGYDYRFGAYWDFGPVSVPLGNKKLLIGWMDSRLGNYTENDNLDIFFARVDRRAATADVQNAASRSDVNLSVALSKLTYPGGNEAVLASTFATRGWSRVVIVNKRDEDRTLAAGVLARAYLGPVLLSNRDGLPQTVKREIKRFDPHGAFVIGGNSQLSGRIERQLENLGVRAEDDEGNPLIERLGGGQAATAAAIAMRLDRRTDAEKTMGAPAFDAAIVVNPDSKAAPAAAVLAANRRLPILFSGKSAAPAATLDALEQLGIDQTLVVGGTGSVSDAALSSLPSPTRLGGDGARSAARATAAESIERIVPFNIVFLTKPGEPMASALVGAAAGRSGGLLLIEKRASIARASNTADALGLDGKVDRFIRVRTR